MRRIISLLLVVAIVIVSGSSIAFAFDSNSITLTVEDVSVHLGDNRVAVEINIQGNTGISGFSFCVNHGESLIFAGAEIEIEGGYKVIKEIGEFGVNLAWTDSVNFSKNGKIATIYFDVADNAEVGNIPLKVIFREGYDSVYKTVDGLEYDLPVQLFDGMCSIIDDTLLNALSVTVESSTAHAGDTIVAVPIRVNNNTGFSGFSFCVNYDKTQLALVRAEISIADGYKVVNHTSGYDICLAWTSATDFTENGEIACLYFRALESAKTGQAQIRIVYRPGFDSFYKTVNQTEQDILCQSENGYIDITHFYGDWEIVNPSTCTQTGIKKRICQHEGCEEAEEVVIPMLSHDYAASITPPSCQNRGYTTYTCSLCHDTYTDNYIDALGHDYVATVVEPTPKEGGYTEHVCSRCHERYVDTYTPRRLIYYSVPSLEGQCCTFIFKSDSNELHFTSDEGKVMVNDIPDDSYRIYVTKNNALTIALPGYDTIQEGYAVTSTVQIPLGDVNHDEVIDIADISLLIGEGNYGLEHPELDLDTLSGISIGDISIILNAVNFGKYSAQIV